MLKRLIILILTVLYGVCVHAENSFPVIDSPYDSSTEWLFLYDSSRGYLCYDGYEFSWTFPSSTSNFDARQWSTVLWKANGQSGLINRFSELYIQVGHPKKLKTIYYDNRNIYTGKTSPQAYLYCDSRSSSIRFMDAVEYDQCHFKSDYVKVRVLPVSSNCQESQLQQEEVRRLFDYLCTTDYWNKAESLRQPEGKYRLKTLEDALTAAKEAEASVKKGGHFIYKDHYGREVEVISQQDKVTYQSGYYCFDFNTAAYGPHANLVMWPDQGYGDPFESCIGKPKCHYSYKIGRTTWIIEIEEQIQLDCKFDDQGHPVRPVVPDEALPTGQRTVDFNMTKRDYDFTIPCTMNCTRRIYQTPRTNKMNMANGTVYGAVGSDADPFAPWRVVQKRVYTLDVSKLAGKLGVDNQLFAFLMMSQLSHVMYMPPQNIEAFKAALYKAFAFKDSPQLRESLKKFAQSLFESEAYYRALHSFVMCGDLDKASQCCDHIFKNSDDLDDLLQDFRIVCNMLFVDEEMAGFDRFIFSGWPAVDPLGSMNSLFPEAGQKFFKIYMLRRDAYIGNIPETSEYRLLRMELERYISENLKFSYQPSFYTYMNESCTGEWGKNVLRLVKWNVYYELLYLRYVYMTTPDRRDEVRVRIGKMRELIDQRYIKPPKGFWIFSKRIALG